MKFINLLKIALKALNNNKLRCFLTMLGIIIGVASVITMLAIGQGSKNSIREQISEMGSNMIMIHPGNMQRGGVRQSADDMQTLEVGDFEAISQLPGVAAASPSVNTGGQLVNGNNNYPSQIYGVTPEYLDIRKFNVKDGSMFSDHDIATAAKVCILGKTVVDNLFPGGEDPVGRVIRFGKIPMTVIGVLESKGTNSMGQDQDDVVIAPYTTVMKRILAIDYIQGIFASATDEDQTEATIDSITELLRQRHKIRDGADDDFSIRSQQELSEMMNSTSDMKTLLLACIAGISLLVGGIGIMN
ncbi:MAG: ABC transporter permease, partial [Paramuribaculum sp.]|nr:ABC transporter permease [Paramuribaculum sp.]